MSRMQRDKGARGEREVAEIFRSAGFECERTPNSGGLWIPGDLVGVSGFCIDSKFQETWRLREWLDQARNEAAGRQIHIATTEPPRNDAKVHTIPVVAFRSSRYPWHAALPLSDFAYLAWLAK